VLVDFSEYSENLINFADHSAEIIRGKVIFVHQITGLAPVMADIETKNRIIKTEIDESYSNLQKLAKGSVHCADAFHFSQKPVLKILKEFKSEQYFDWVFTGLKDTGVLERIFICSTTISIIDNSDLLTVAGPIQTEISVPKKIPFCIY
jgi:trimethylamine:corrinoid methyltransferase-like protein